MPLHLDPEMTQKVREHFQRDVRIIDGLLSDEDPQPDRWPIEPGSDLARDDLAMEGAGELISAQAHRLLHASTDFLHGVSAMILRAKVLHTYAEYAMIRSGLECAGYAWWLLEPARQVERITRSLRLYWQDQMDRNELVRLTSPAARDTMRERLPTRNAIAQRNGIDPAKLDGGVKATAVLKRMSDLNDSGVLTAWRVASGMTHGRIWAMGVLSTTEVVGESHGSTVPAYISGDPDALAMIYHNAAIALQDAHALFHKRRVQTRRTALGLPL